jgi:hypothetical protein
MGPELLGSFSGLRASFVVAIDLHLPPTGAAWQVHKEQIGRLGGSLLIHWKRHQ